MSTDERKDFEQPVKHDDQQQPEIKDLTSKRLDEEEERKVKGGFNYAPEQDQLL